MATVKTTTGEVLQIDQQDLESINTKSFYAQLLPSDRLKITAWINGKQLYLAKAILTARGITVDKKHTVAHTNNDDKDFRFDNLKLVTKSERIITRQTIRAHHKFKGVSPHRGAFRVRIQENGKTKETSGFKTPEDAALHYDFLALKIHGSNAVLNFPEKREAMEKHVGRRNLGKQKPNGKSKPRTT